MMKHPFSAHGVSDFIYDFYLDDKVVDFYSTQMDFNPTMNEMEVSNHQEVVQSKVGVWMVRNIPSFIKLRPNQRQKDWTMGSVAQYNGYGICLSNFESLEDYLNKQFSSRNRRKLRMKIRKLNEMGGLKYKLYDKEVSWEVHLEHFRGFYKMLKKRFDEIQMYNRNLIHWAFFCAQSFKKIKEGKAILLVVELNGKPIAYSLDYIQQGLVFGIFQTHDIEYNPYNIGDISMYRKLEWCFENQKTFYDFSIGGNYFKQKWADLEYPFQYHLWYKDTLLGKLRYAKVKYALHIRQFLRNKGVLGGLFEYDKFFYKKQMEKLQDFDWEKGLNEGSIT